MSFYWIKGWLRYRDNYTFRDWALDSGAFSAHNIGAPIDLQEYVEFCKSQLDDPLLTDVFGLDVIGDADASLRNVDKMWEAGVEAIPTFHIGSPWSALKHIAENYPKIAVGGLVGVAPAKKDAWLREVFARAWPKKIHGFGCGGGNTLLAYPFHSADATNWCAGPLRFGRWMSYGGGNPGIRGIKHNLRPEVEHYLDFEKRVRAKWSKQMKELEEL